MNTEAYVGTVDQSDALTGLQRRQFSTPLLDDGLDCCGKDMWLYGCVFL